MRLHADSLAALDAARRLAGNRGGVVFVSGNFNVVHPGHLRLLRFAADCGNLLVVGVHDDTSEGVIVPEALRLEAVRAISFVDVAFALRDPAEVFVRALRPAIVVKGKEYENRSNPELAAVDSYGGRLLFSSGEVVFSSVDLLRSEILDHRRLPIQVPRDFMDRHDLTALGLKQIIRKFEGLRVAVIGDLIVDEYINCDPLGMSEEDPTIVVTPVALDRFVGGAGIVAAHARGLGAQVRFFSVAGQDEPRTYALQRLKDFGVETSVEEDDSRPTTLKQRYRAEGKTLLRVSHLRRHGVNAEIGSRLLSALEATLIDTDLVMFADFNYGCLPQPVVEAISAACRRRGIPMVADSQSSSQVGDVSRFRGMRLLTPTEREARLALRDFDSGLAVVADELCQRADAQNVIITLGTEGLLVHAPILQEPVWHTDRLPALNVAPMDPAGAGDSLFCCASLALCVGANIWESAYLGAMAAACQVARVGNSPLGSTDVEALLAG